MQFVHTQKYIRMAPRKVRLMADLVRKMNVDEALEVLPFTQKRASEPLLRVLKAAKANIKENSNLIIKDIQVGDGPALKRGRPVSRGQWHPYKRRMSHIRVVLETKVLKVKDVKKVETKLIKKTNTEARSKKIETIKKVQDSNKDKSKNGKEQS